MILPDVADEDKQLINSTNLIVGHAQTECTWSFAINIVEQSGCKFIIMIQSLCVVICQALIKVFHSRKSFGLGFTWF